MRFKHTHRPGFWLGFIDFFTAGLFFLLYMPLGGLQEELDEILGREDPAVLGRVPAGDPDGVHLSARLDVPDCGRTEG